MILFLLGEYGGGDFFCKKGGKTAVLCCSATLVSLQGFSGSGSVDKKKGSDESCWWKRMLWRRTLW